MDIVPATAHGMLIRKYFLFSAGSSPGFANTASAKGISAQIPQVKPQV